MDDNRLVKDITLSLYSSLEIEKSLRETVRLLSAYLPLDLIHVFILDLSTRTMRYLAEATAKWGMMIDERIQLSPEQLSEFHDASTGEIRILTRTESPLLQFLQGHFRKHVKKPMLGPDEHFSVITMGFDIGHPLVGGVGMVARGNRRFTDAHVEKVTLIQRPMIGAVLNLLHHRDVVSENARLTKEKIALESRLGHHSAGEIIGATSGLRRVTDMVRQVADLPSPVLLLGETGTGKEVVATAIHQTSGRADGPMIRVNCGAIAESLMDSELFGHEKGAFTGANHLKRGYFEQADGGTIFLDEIADLPLAAQVKLLRVLQSMEFHRVGGTWPVSVDVRILAATHRDLATMVKENRFREDLWFRLNVFPIRIPPLRDRKEDIPALADYFVVRKSREMNLSRPPEIMPEALALLSGYDWPGNIRELQNVIERALILGRGHTLSFEGLIPFAENSIAQQSLVRRESGVLPLDTVVANHIRHALTVSGGKVEGPGGAAELLEIHPSTLRSRMKKLNLKLSRTV